MSNDINSTTPMPGFLPLDSPTEKLSAVYGVLSEMQARIEGVQEDSEVALRDLGATFDEAFDLTSPHSSTELDGRGWDRFSVEAAIYAEVRRRKGTPLPGLEDAGR